MPRHLTVNRSNITDIAMSDAPTRALVPGDVRLTLQSFALTANNVTYAASGDAIGYWKFFPSGIDGRGIVPVWGTAVVAETRSDLLSAGDRLYGFFPMAGELVIRAEASGANIVDAAPHRAKLPPIYNRYYRVTEPPSADDHLRAIFQPLLATSFLIADWLDDNAWFGAEQVIVGSASSKTGLGLGMYIQDYPDRPVRTVGLTSQRNVEFVERTGALDGVITYADLEAIAPLASVYVDMAGDSGVKRRLHAHLGDRLKHSSAVGLSHWDAFDPGADLPGPKPQFFFAPAQAEKRRADWGAAEVDRRIASAWRRVAATAGDWMAVRLHDSLDAAVPVYQDLAAGRADPGDGHIIRLSA